MQDWPRAPKLTDGFSLPHVDAGGSLDPAMVGPPPPLPTDSAMRDFFRESRAMIAGYTDNNAGLEHGRLGDTGYTGGAGFKVGMEKPRCSSVGLGADMRLYTEHPRIEGGRTRLGMLRDEEARAYASIGLEGACTQHIVDQLRTFLPWANITSVSIEGRLGVAGSRNWGGLRVQNEIHHALATGGTLESHGLANEYDSENKRIGPYGYASAETISRVGESPLSVGLHATGEVAPAGTSRVTMGVNVQVGDTFYVKVGLDGNLQKSALGDFDGAPKDGPFATAFGAAGYRGGLGSGVELRVSQNPQGTGLGMSALGDDRNLAASVFVRLTTESLRKFFGKLAF